MTQGIISEGQGPEAIVTDARTTTSQSWPSRPSGARRRSRTSCTRPTSPRRQTHRALQLVQPVGQVSAPQPGTAAIAAALLWHVATPSSSFIQLSSAGASIQRAQPSLQLRGLEELVQRHDAAVRRRARQRRDYRCGASWARAPVLLEGAGVGFGEGAGVGRKLGLNGRV